MTNAALTVTTAPVTPALNITAVEQVLAMGDLSKLSPTDRLAYLAQVCASLGLNPLTRPFQYIELQGKLTLYATRGAADQLRRVHGVSIALIEREQIGDVYVVTAYARTPDGREDSSTGAVSTKGLAGDALANAFMKAETKAKRRVTLSIVGLGLLDESEMDSVPGARHTIDAQTGEVLETRRATASGNGVATVRERLAERTGDERRQPPLPPVQLDPRVPVKDKPAPATGAASGNGSGDQRYVSPAGVAALLKLVAPFGFDRAWLDGFVRERQGVEDADHLTPALYNDAATQLRQFVAEMAKSEAV